MTHSIFPVSRRWVTLSLALAALAVGCHRNEPPAPIASDQIPQALQTAFQQAGAPQKAEADAAAAALKNDEQGQALEALERLSRQPGLTPEQREAATRSAISVRQKIIAAAAAGDRAAKEFLEQQAASK